MLNKYSGQRTPAAQFTGISDAVILDTDETNTTLPPGTARVTIPSLSTTTAFGPTPYPSTAAPDPGTPVVVAFIPPAPNQPTQISLRILSLPGVAGGGPSGDVPIADKRNAAIDRTHYPNTLLNDGSFYTTLVSQSGTAAISLAQTGDTHPEILLAADGAATIYLSDGTTDPVTAGSSIVGTSTGLSISTPSGTPLTLNGVAISPAPPATGQVLTATSPSAADWQDATGGGAFIPIADDRNATVNSTSYPNTIFGSGNFTTLVSQEGTAAISLAQTGDDFPEILIFTAATEGPGVFFGDGTFDAADGSSDSFIVFNPGDGSPHGLTLGCNGTQGLSIANNAEGDSAVAASSPGILITDNSSSGHNGLYLTQEGNDGVTINNDGTGPITISSAGDEVSIYTNNGEPSITLSGVEFPAYSGQILLNNNSPLVTETDGIVLTDHDSVSGIVIRTDSTAGLSLFASKMGFFTTSPISQPSAITPPSGGSTIDTQARTAINSIINVLGATSGLGLTL